MITRGYFIGQIIDEFGEVARQAKQRAAFTLTDMSVYCENFFRDVINIVEGLSLVNLNEERQNEPGLDLADTSKKIAFQVTSTNTSQKVNKTLGKITDDQRTAYDRFVILIIGDKHATYGAVDGDLATKNKFSVDRDIWDLGDIARKAIGMKIDRLQALHDLVRKEMARVKVELEIPDQDGKYETSGYDQWEAIPTPKVEDGSQFNAWLVDDNATQADPTWLQKDLVSIARRISALPRISREFLVMLFDRCEPDRRGRFQEHPSLVLGKVQRMYTGGDLDGELALLIDAELVALDGVDDDAEDRRPPEIGLYLGVKCDELAIGFYDFVVKNELSFRKVIGEVDLSAF